MFISYCDDGPGYSILNLAIGSFGPSMSLSLGPNLRMQL
jgi:hypothetical protein